MNVISLVGRLTKDVSTSYTTDGKCIARFTVAVDRFWKIDAGADFISVVAFNKTAEFIEKYFGKGQRIGIVGHITTGSYTNKDGQKVYTTDVVADNVEFVESKASPSKETNNDEYVAIPDGVDEELPLA